MSQKVNCLRCGNEMTYYSSERLQLGQTGWILGDLPNLIAGSLRVRIFVCGHCGKLEFFADPETISESQELPQRIRPKCGAKHDFDDPKCPFCKHNYYAR